MKQKSSPKNKNAGIGVGMLLLASSIFTFAQAEKPAAPQATTSEWKPLDDAMGRSGQMQPGDVIKFAMPRKDLKVVVNGVNVKPGLALGSWAAFKREGSSAMVMGGDDEAAAGRHRADRSSQSFTA